MTESARTDASGGFSGLLFLVFLVLKLTDVIDWSWWWVTAPLWVPLAVVAVILAFIGVIMLVAKVDFKGNAR
jgi:hypothetical protein